MRGQRPPAGRPSAPITRLTSADRMYLHDERPAWPCHFGGLAVVDGRALLDPSGRLRIEEVRDRLNRRLARVPDLRQRIWSPGLLRGGPIWVDDQRFSIDHHVHEAPIDGAGGDRELLETAAGIYARLLDRTRPLWELWFITGLSDGRVGVLLKLHHAVADGSAAVAVMGSLFDVDGDARDPGPGEWRPGPIPTGRSLFAENAFGKVRTIGRAAALLTHPIRIVRAAQVVAVVMRRMLGQKGAPRTSLNQVVQAGRRVGFLRLDLAAVKGVAHAHHGKVNDVVLDLWSGGLGRLLASRGERVAGVELVAGQAVSLRSGSGAAAVDNQAGTIILRLPVGESDPGRRLDLIVATTSRTKAIQQPGAIMAVMAALSATPLARYFNLHQRAVNVIVTNVVGPAAPMDIFGARVLDVVPIVQLVGNIGLTLCAFSYAGQLSLVVTADARGFPDLDVLLAGMQRDWDALVAARNPEPMQLAEPVPA